MIPPQQTPDEARRLEALRRYAVLDTPAERDFDELAALAAQICEAPIALVSLVDETRQWFKARVGMDLAETAREISFCGHALGAMDLFVVSDALKDERFADNPLVVGEPGVRFYTGAPLRTPEGQVLGALCVMDRVPRTLTPGQEQALRVLSRQIMTQFDLRRQARGLAENERLLQAVFDAEPECVKLLSADGTVQMMNPAGLQIIEADSLEQLNGCCVFPLIWTEHRAQFEALTERVFRGESGMLEFRATGLKGTPRWLETHAAPLRDESGAVSALLGITRDITRRKQAEQALRASEEHQRAIVDSSLDAVLTIDAEGCILEFNPAAERMFGHARDTVIGRNMADVIVPVHLRARHRQGLARYLATREATLLNKRIELPALRADGTEFPVELSITRIGQGEPPQFTGFIRDITERKQAEEALQRSKEDLQLSLDAARLGTWDWNITTGKVAWSARCLAIYGIPSGGEVTYERFLQALHPDDRVRIDAALKRAVEERELYDEEKRVIWPDGSLHWTASRAQVYSDAAGQPVRMTGVTFDITDRKLAEAGRQASEERYRTLFDYAPDGIVIADADSYYLDANASALQMLGYTRDELIGLHGSDIVAPAEAPHIETALKVINGGADYQREWKLRRKNGSVFTADVIATKMPDGNLLGMIRDATERKRTEARFHRLVDSSAHGVLFWKVNGEITEANEAFLRLVGYSREDLAAGRINWVAMTPPEYAGLDRRALEEIAIKGTCTPFEKEYLRKDGSRVPVLIGPANFQDSPEEGVCFVVDLTERKKLEQQFLRSQRMESIGTLAGGIAHDLNNVLGPIIMSLDLLKLNFTDPSSQELLAIIGSSAQRGADMVRQVLSFARGIEGRRMEVQMKHLIRDIEKIVGDTFLKHIQVRTIVPPNLWAVTGDPTQLHQVLLNLCVNARDAMPNGGKLIISAENRTLDEQYAGLNLDAKPGPYVFIQVEDSGTGVAPELMEKIFDPFFTTKEVGKGTGLGLSTSLAIIKSHDGFIRVYSELGRGAKFSVYLPAQTEAFGSAVPEVAEMPRGSGESILVVDDEISVRQITQQTLQAFGYRVIVASDGAEGLAIYARQRDQINVVLTDMMMPVMDGPALIQVLQKMNPDLPIIAASGLSTNEHAARAKTLGVKHFLPKPFTAEALLKTLKQVLSEKRK